MSVQLNKLTVLIQKLMLQTHESQDKDKKVLLTILEKRAREFLQKIQNRLALGPELTEEQAKAIFAFGEEAVVFALLKLAKMAAEQNPNQLTVGSPDECVFHSQTTWPQSG